MTTGLHKVCDIYCVSCDQLLGWKYVKFKNKIIIKKQLVKSL